MTLLSQTLARPYAKAVFQIALERGSLESWSRFLQAIATFVEVPDFHHLFDNPKILADQLVELLATLLKEEWIEEGRAFLLLLVRERRLFLVSAIASLFQTLCREQAQQLDVQVISTFELEEEQRQQLKTVLEKRFHKNVVIHDQIDPSLLGGAIIRIGDLQIDGSGRGRLHQLKTYLKEHTICL